MFRIIAACTLGLAAVTALPASPAMADKSWRSSLDDAEPIPNSWTATGRFAQVTLAGSDEVIVTRGDRWQIRASGSPAVIADLRFEVEDGNLLIGRRWRRTPVAGVARIEVVAPDVEAVTLAGSGMLRVDAMKGDEVDVTVDRPRDSVTFEGVLSTDDETVTLRIARFVDLAGSIAEPWTGADLATWHEKRRRRVWPMPPVGE